jgi:hypothetical protein
MSTTTNPLPPAITKRTPNLENKVLATKLHHSATKKQNFIKSESKKSKKKSGLSRRELNPGLERVERLGTVDPGLQ